MKSKAGFTKKDAVVILGCVAFLLANIAAIGSGGHRRAKEAVCLSNLRQWGIIFQTYTNEHDGYFMGGHGLPDPSETWLQSLRPYYGEQGGIMCCPMAAKKPDGLGLGGTTFEPWGLLSNGDYGSYGINTFIYNRPEGGIMGRPGTEGHFWRRTDVKGAAIVPLLLDALWFCSPPWSTDEPLEYEGQGWTPGGAGCSSMGMFCINRHNGFVNGLFMDFSVRKIGLKELWKLKWSREFDVNGPWTLAGGVTYDDWANHGTGWMKDFKDY